jgi:hypothetical protein
MAALPLIVRNSAQMEWSGAVGDFQFVSAPLPLRPALRRARPRTERVFFHG